MGRIVAPDPMTLRARAGGWARYIRAKNRYPSVSAMAKEMAYNQGSLNAIINGKGTVGLDFVIKLALVGQESLDTICLREPPAAYAAPPRAASAPGTSHPGELHEPDVTYPAKAPRKRARPHRDLPHA